MVVALVRPVGYFVGGWNAPFGIVYNIDGLNALVVVLIQLVALLAIVHGGPIVKRDIGDHRHFYYGLYLLFIVGVTGITQTADAFNLYVLIEVASLTSYALIAVGHKRSVHAGLNYLLVGSIGATFYLLGIGYLYIKTGTLNMQDLHAVMTAQQLFASPTVQVALILLIVGLWIKMAFFPFHGWLPNAYTWSPLTSAAMMSPLMTKVMVYVMIRVMLSVFGLENVMELPGPKPCPTSRWSRFFMDRSWHWLKKMCAGSSPISLCRRSGIWSELPGWAPNGDLPAAVYHILSDSLMTLCLFSPQVH